MEQQKFDIFLSYRRTEGWELARLIYEVLSKNGHNVFLDVERLYKGKFDSKLQKILQDSKIFIPILTRNTLDRCVKNNQDWVRKEIMYAFDHQIIVPIVDDSFVMPKNIEQKFKNLIDDKKYPVIRISKNNYDEAINKLHKVILKFTISNKNTPNNIARFNEKYILQVQKEFHKKYNTKETNKFMKTMYKKFEPRLISFFNNQLLLDNNTKNMICDYLNKNLNKQTKLNVLEICGDDFSFTYKVFGPNSVKSLCLSHYHPFFLKGIEKFLGSKFKNTKIRSKNLFLCDTKLESRLKLLTNNLKNKFDVVIFNCVLDKYKNIAEIIKNFKNVLVNEGILIISQWEDKFDLLFPDTNNLYSKYKNILDDVSVKYNQNTNDLIYPILKNNNFKSLSLFTNFHFDPTITYFDKEKSFINTYKTITNHLQAKADNKLGDEQSAAKLKWMRHNYDRIHDILCADKTLQLRTTLIWMAKK